MTIHLLFGIHAHQPLGSPPAVIDAAHARCYRMFLRVVDQYPDFHFSVHFSGGLLDTLREHYPEDMALLAKMTVRGQVEWFGGGDCAPVLAAIPQRDRLSQMNAHAARLEDYVGKRPRGAWLTERVWDSSVVPVLADAGIRYTVVDDYHFLCTGLPPQRLDSFYTTEEDGRTLDLFPISEALRYRLPFSPADEAVAYLESLAHQGWKAAVHFDDIGKFGLWPETHAWVYERGWLARFIEGVLASPAIRTDTYAGYRAHSGVGTHGLVYLPTASHVEMNEWTLPPEAAGDYARLVAAEKTAGSYERHKGLLRGGIWRNFLTCYPEANWMHKRMLGLSKRLADLPAEARSAEMTTLLHRAQGSDAYWHGSSGGIYQPHLRRAVWQNLIALEGALDRVVARPATLERGDIDFDGKEEFVQSGPQLQAVSRHDGEACIVELTSYVLAHNFVDTLRRRVERYHAEIDCAAENDTAIVSGDLLPDRRPRAMFVDSRVDIHGEHLALDAYHLVSAAPRGIVFSTRCGRGHIEKQYRMDDDKLVVRYRGTEIENSSIGIQINLSMPGRNGQGGHYRLEGGDVSHGFGQELTLEHVHDIALEDSALGGGLALHFDRPLRLHAAPYYTVSQSETGFEKIMQGICLDILWMPVSHMFGSHAQPSTHHAPGDNRGWGNAADETLTIVLSVNSIGPLTGERAA